MRDGGRTADAELLHLVQQGSKAALEALYLRYLPSVWRYVYYRVAGDRHVAEDVVSETFLAVLQGLKKLDADSRPLYPWMIGVARHKLGDHWRKTGPLKSSLALAGQDVADCSASSEPPRFLEAAESRAQTAHTMARLADEERLVLEWKYVDELSVREMALRMGRTEKAIENLLYRARRSFRAVHKAV